MLAVTTRNKLRNSRFALPMLRARRYIREQLAETPGLIRYVSSIASPTEFMTFTVWENRQTMFNFMSSSAHEKFMWMFTRWSTSFWSMRWIPTTAEEGTWDGLSLATLVKPRDQLWREAHPETPQLPLPEQQPARTLGRRVIDPSTSSIYAITALVEAASPEHLWRLLHAERELRRVADHAQLLRWNISSAGLRRFLLLTLWREGSAEPAEEVSMLHRGLNACWTMYWTAGEYEIGHWDGLRLRQLVSARDRQKHLKHEVAAPIHFDIQ